MRKIVLTFGLIAGAILAGMMFLTLTVWKTLDFDRGEVVGYTTMVVAFLLIYFGVRSYRDNVAGGTIRFGKAFAVAAMIGAVASLCYVAAWEVIYFKLRPDFVEKYQAHVLEKARASGATEAAIAARKAELEKFAKMYDNIAINAAITFLEPLPVALIVSLISAGMLSRKKKDAASPGAVGAASSMRAT